MKALLGLFLIAPFLRMQGQDSCSAIQIVEVIDGITLGPSAAGGKQGYVKSHRAFKTESMGDSSIRLGMFYKNVRPYIFCDKNYKAQSQFKRAVASEYCKYGFVFASVGIGILYSSLSIGRLPQEGGSPNISITAGGVALSGILVSYIFQRSYFAAAIRNHNKKS